MLTNEKHSDLEDRESDFYNVTVNLVVRRMTQFQAQATHEKKMAQKAAKSGLVQQQAQNVVESRPEDQAQVLTFTDLITSLENQGGLIISDSKDDGEDDDAEIQEQSENVHPMKRANKFTEYIVPKDKKDQVDEVFSKIQDEDMRQEQSYDQNIPKNAAIQQEMAHEREHEQFLRRLDRNHMSSVTTGNKVAITEQVESVPEAETNTATEESHQQED